MRENLIRGKHSGGLASHFGHEKTFEQFQHFYFWPKMRYKVQNFVSKWKICQHEKGKIQNIAIYTPFPIPNRPWDSSMDFVLSLPKTQKGYDSIFVVVDIFLKMAHFIAFFKTSDTTHIANLFFREVITLHGFPTNIVLDRDSKLLGNFWRILWKKMDTRLDYNSSYHP